MGVDTMGNMFARREGTDPDALPVYVGSHLDTQPTGGKYDGVLGVLGGLEIVRTLNDLDIKTKHPIVVTNWTNEEGTRFAPAMLASGVFAGVHERDWAYDRVDAKGKSFGDELERIGWKGDEPVGERARCTPSSSCTSSRARSWRPRARTSASSRTGRGSPGRRSRSPARKAIPARRRCRCARTPASAWRRILELVDEIAWSHKPDAVGAAGHIDIYPNSRNVIPGKAVFTVDFRSPDLEVIQDMEQRLRGGRQEDLRRDGARRRVREGRRLRSRSKFDENCVKAVRDAAERLGYSHRNIISGAGHDACWINARGADRDGHVPLRRRPVPQRGRGDLAGMGRAPAPTCCSTRWSRRRRSWSERE